MLKEAMPKEATPKEAGEEAGDAKERRSRMLVPKEEDGVRRWHQEEEGRRRTMAPRSRRTKNDADA